MTAASDFTGSNWLITALATTNHDPKGSFLSSAPRTVPECCSSACSACWKSVSLRHFSTGKPCLRSASFAYESHYIQCRYLNPPLLISPWWSVYWICGRTSFDEASESQEELLSKPSAFVWIFASQVICLLSFGTCWLCVWIFVLAKAHESLIWIVSSMMEVRFVKVQVTR